MAIKTPNVPDVIVSQLIQCFRVSTKGSIEGSILDSQCTIMCSKIKQQVFCSFVVSCFANSIYCDDDMRLEEKVKIADQTKLSQKEHREYLITKEFWPGSDGGGSGRAQGGGAVGLRAAAGCRAGSCLSERKWQILLLDNETSLFVLHTVCFSWE